MLVICSRLPIDLWPTLFRHAPNQFVFLPLGFPLLALALLLLFRVGRKFGVLTQATLVKTGIVAVIVATPTALLDHHSDQPDWYASTPAHLPTLAKEQRAIHRWIDEHPGTATRAALLTSAWYAERARERAKQRQPTTLAIDAFYRWGAATDPLLHTCEQLELFVVLHCILTTTFLLTTTLAIAAVRRLKPAALTSLLQQLTTPIILMTLSATFFACCRAINVHGIEMVKTSVTSIPPGIILAGAFVCIWQWLILRLCTTGLGDRSAHLLIAVALLPALCTLLMEHRHPGSLSGSHGLAQHRLSTALLVLAVGCLIETMVAAVLVRRRLGFPAAEAPRREGIRPTSSR